MLGNASFISYDNMVLHCIGFKLSLFISTSNNAAKILLLLPLCSFVLYHGQQKWRQQRCFKTASHSDIFTYHLAAMELIWIFGCSLFLVGTFTYHSMITKVGLYFAYVPFYGELVLNLLTCIERYLAVVHPLTYRNLKSHRGTRVRNVSIGCAWVFCFGLVTFFRGLRLNHATVFVFCFFVLSILAVSFCSISVLCVLIHPGSKEDKVDPRRRRAFCTITVISSGVWLGFVGHLVCHSLNQSIQESQSTECLLMAAVSWLGLPCSVALPLLYLHKTRKSLCCRT